MLRSGDLPSAARARDRSHHEHDDPHHRESPLSDIVLGGQDGIVNVLGVLLGVAAATGDSRVVLAAGLATAVAESISMAAVAYTSKTAEGALYESERARELRHIAVVPELERAEIRELFAQKGFEGELLERIVATITSDKQVWVALMMAEEHRLAPVSRASALRSALVVGVSASVGSLIPVVPFLVLSPSTGSWWSVLVAAATLFLLGTYKAKVTRGRAVKSGIEIALIGIASAFAGYLIGVIFQVPASP